MVEKKTRMNKKMKTVQIKLGPYHTMERTVEKLKRERENQGGEKKKKKKKKKRRRTENFGVSLAMQDRACRTISLITDLLTIKLTTFEICKDTCIPPDQNLHKVATQR